MITHSVVFRLRHGRGSPDEAAFIKAALGLARIPSVQNLQVQRQVSPKAPYTFVLSMEFSSQAAYDGYMNHADHVAFTRERWEAEVVDFMILDYAPLGRNPMPRPRPGSRT